MVIDVVLAALTPSVAPAGTPTRLLATGIAGVPGAPGASVFGSTSFVHAWPPPVCGTKRSCGSRTRTRIPFSSLRRTLVFVLVRSLGVTPPPQRFVRVSASSLRLAVIDDVPRPASR